MNEESCKRVEPRCPTVRQFQGMMTTNVPGGNLEVACQWTYPRAHPLSENDNACFEKRIESKVDTASSYYVKREERGEPLKHCKGDDGVDLICTRRACCSSGEPCRGVAVRCAEIMIEMYDNWG
jgi:hypothetical protein